MPQHVLILGKVWPEPSSSAAGSRMMQLISLFRGQKWKITFATSAGESEYAADLELAGVKTASIELNNSSFDHFVKKLDPSIVLFDRFSTEEQFGWRVTQHCPDALRILDTEDLHCLRWARQHALKEKRPFQVNDLNNEIARREIASIYRSDLSLIISAVEMGFLKTFFNIDKNLLHPIPFLLEALSKKEQSKLPDFSARKPFISIGNFLHEPNWDAVLFLKQEIWPMIRKELPAAELHVYGAYPSHKVFALHNPKEKFLIKGRADNLKEVMSHARVCLAPLRFGAGLKGKLADAMRYGTPNVTTSVGAEAMHGSLPWSGIVADNAKNFSQAAVKLYSQENDWYEAQQNGFNIVNKLFSSKRHGVALINKILLLQSTLKEHRKNNFMGSMLMHHTTQSTRYMALWIEAKNKIKN